MTDVGAVATIVGSAASPEFRFRATFVPHAADRDAVDSAA